MPVELSQHEVLLARMTCKELVIVQCLDAVE